MVSSWYAVQWGRTHCLRIGHGWQVNKRRASVGPLCAWLGISLFQISLFTLRAEPTNVSLRAPVLQKEISSQKQLFEELVESFLPASWASYRETTLQFDRYLSQVIFTDPPKDPKSRLHFQKNQDELCRSPSGSTEAPLFCLSSDEITSLSVFWSREALKNAPISLPDRSSHRKPPRPTRLFPIIERTGSGLRVPNWGHLQKGKAAQLIKGLSTIPISILFYFETKALFDTHCPNPMAIATASILEDFAPRSIPFERVSSLYETVRRCPVSPSGISPEEKVRYLTRAGLLRYVAQDLEHAKQDMEEAVKIKETDTSMPLYWLFRIEKERLGIQKADTAQRALLAREELLQKYPFSYHTVLAQLEDKLPLAYRTDHCVLPLWAKTDEELERFLKRVSLLYKYGATLSARRYGAWGLSHFGARNLDPSAALILFALGGSEVKSYQVLPILSEAPSLSCTPVLELAFPRPYFEQFNSQKRMDPYFLLSVARQESSFDPVAESSASAQGIMQLIESTALRYSRGTKIDLANPDMSIKVASRYFLYLKTIFNGRHYLMLAAYNAGEDRVLDWMDRYASIQSPSLFIDLIPYRETRNYVRRVLLNDFFYRLLYDPSHWTPSVDNLLGIPTPPSREQTPAKSAMCATCQQGGLNDEKSID